MCKNVQFLSKNVTFCQKMSLFCQKFTKVSSSLIVWFYFMCNFCAKICVFCHFLSIFVNFLQILSPRKNMCATYVHICHKSTIKAYIQLYTIVTQFVQSIKILCIFVKKMSKNRYFCHFLWFFMIFHEIYIQF